MTKREKMQRAFELLNEAAKLLDQIAEPEAGLFLSRFRNVQTE
jgi:hypothetical protein